MRTLLLLSFVFGVLLFTKAQTVTNQLIGVAGSSDFNDTYQLDWSIGEITTSALLSGDYVIIQGFQALPDTLVFALSNSEINDLKLRIYAGERDNEIIIKVANENTELLDFQLLDTRGIKLESNTFTLETRLNFSTYPTGIYFIAISRKDKLIDTIKIIKP